MATGMAPVNGRTVRATTETPSHGWQRPARNARTAANGTGAPAEIKIHIDSDRSILDARRHARRLATSAGLGASDLAMVVTAVSELARNALLFAEGGDII